MHSTILNWDLSISLTARHACSHVKLYRHDGAFHLVWGKLSILIENWTLEIHPLCAECGSVEVGEMRHGDEGWTVCQSCRSIESGYRYVNLREYNAA